MSNLGTYHYNAVSSYYPRMQYSKQELRVRVLDHRTNRDGTKQVHVEFLGWHADKRGPGSKTWVAQRKVRMDQPEQAAQTKPAEPIREIRKPYKDD